MFIVHIENCYSLEHILESVTQRLPDLIRTHGVRFLVIDSIAGVARTEFNHNAIGDMIDRTALFFKLSSKLKWLADTFNLVVVVINQVTATGFFDSHGNSPLTGGPYSARSGVQPALGYIKIFLYLCVFNVLT